MYKEIYTQFAKLSAVVFLAAFLFWGAAYRQLRYTFYKSDRI